MRKLLLSMAVLSVLGGCTQAPPQVVEHKTTEVHNNTEKTVQVSPAAPSQPPPVNVQVSAPPAPPASPSTQTTTKVESQTDPNTKTTTEVKTNN